MFGLSRIGEVSGGQFSENGKVRRAIKTILEVLGYRWLGGGIR